jgi:leader peptidase (prepilin peptidase)/N-methyltransferase
MFVLEATILGLLVGSFLNVLILRHGVKEMTGRSVCLSCGRQIAWYDNIPLISYIALRGACRHCKSSISLQYPLVEAATGILFGLVAGSLGELLPGALLPCALAILIAAALIAIAAYDMRHTVIPDSWSYFFSLCALLYALVQLAPGQSLLFALLAGPIAALPLAALWLVSRGAWMGFGDVKLALGIGWLLGPIYGIGAIFFAFMLGAVVSLAILLPLPLYARMLAGWGIVRRGASASYTMKSEVPFGPFLIASAIFVWLTHLYGIPLPLFPLL